MDRRVIPRRPLPSTCPTLFAELTRLATFPNTTCSRIFDHLQSSVKDAMKPKARRRGGSDVTASKVRMPRDKQLPPSKIQSLPLTRVTIALVATRQLAEAADIHNSTVRRDLRRARTGRIINLSDLVASKEILLVAGQRLHPRKSRGGTEDHCERVDFADHKST